MPALPAPAESRAERRKRETRTRLLDAALRVFQERGYDAATTGEIATAADLGAGTFYLHFRDKRDLYEALARRAAREMIGRWREGLRPGMMADEVVGLALETIAGFWSEDRDRARLLLEGGPSFGSEAHVRLVEDVAGMLRDVGPRAPAGGAPHDVVATFVVGLGIELGRLITGSPPGAVRRTVAQTIELARRALARAGPIGRART
jgi:AcrR family transcriptional regulator